LRVIAGEFKGRKLAAVRGRRVRPTADRIRESIFNIISRGIQGAAVLDLFAGTGALAIEAISRGAASAVLIDHHKDSLATIHRNIATCHLGPRTRVIRWRIEKNLACLGTSPAQFDLVFMDPPYDRGLILPALENLARSRCLAGNARIIVEHAEGERLTEIAPSFQEEDQRRYGKTLVSFLSHMV
jgi:16S rRNA (guanine966-N2)-methyltransferase